MRTWTIIIVLLVYAFSTIPVEITDNFLSYLIPFILGVAGLAIAIVNFRNVRHLTGLNKTAAKFLNWGIVVFYSLISLWDFPIPVDRGYRNKNWTDMVMYINPSDKSEQYVSQHIEFGGSDMPGQFVKVKPINNYFRWRFSSNEHMIKDGKWLFINNSGGNNSPPFNLNETHINFERDYLKAKIVRIENGKQLDN